MQENGILRALNFKFSWGSMPPNPPSLLGANHSCKILDPPLSLIFFSLSRETQGIANRHTGPKPSLEMFLRDLQAKLTPMNIKAS